MRDPLVPTCNIMGVDIAAVDLPYAVAYVEQRIDDLRGNYICVSNVHTTVMSFEDPNYRLIQNGSAISIPDGGPLSVVGRRRGYDTMGRVAGPDLMRVLFERSEINRLSHFFFGATDETLSKLRRSLQKDYPSLSIAGMFSPPFGEAGESEDMQHLDVINRSGADIVWIGLGAPKQERWMAEHEGKVHALMVGVGAGFDYFAGNIYRAPKWMQNHSLEWLYRLKQEPVRLAGRYANTNGKFIWHAVMRGA